MESRRGSLSEARFEHTATLLADGRVVVAGGARGPYTLSSVEVFDPKTGAWSSGPSMTSARSEHTATLLADGRTLITGGQDKGAAHDSTETLDPLAMSLDAQSGHAPEEGGTPGDALRGRPSVLVTGGGSVSPDSLVEIYDPALGRVEPRGEDAHVSTDRAQDYAAVGRYGAGVGRAGESWCRRWRTRELYVPGAGSWSPTALVRDPRWGQVALSLADGSPMIIGGLDNDGWSLKSAEYYDAESRRWSFAGEMQYGRWGHAATLRSRTAMW